MKSTLRWLIAGLVAAALLIGVGWWLGHRSVTTPARDAQAWRDSTAVLLGEADAAHRAVVDSLLGVADSLTRQAARLAGQRDRATAQVSRWTAEADTLQAMLAHAEFRVDSLAIYPALVAVKDSTIGAQREAIGALEAGLASAEQSKGVLRTVLAAKDTRITVLEQQLATAPKPPRLELRLFGGRFRPGCAAGVDARLDPRLVCGVTVTR